MQRKKTLKKNINRKLDARTMIFFYWKKLVCAGFPPAREGQKCVDSKNSGMAKSLDLCIIGR